MLAIFLGDLAFLVGLAILLLPLMVTELSRPRDVILGISTLLLGLVLVTSHDRLNGSPILGIICGAIIIMKLGSEVAHNRWQDLTQEEKHRLGSLERWMTSLQQLSAIGFRTGGIFGDLIKVIRIPGKATTSGKKNGKKWIRPEILTNQNPINSVNMSSGEGSSGQNKVIEAKLEMPSKSHGAQKDS